MNMSLKILPVISDSLNECMDPGLSAPEAAANPLEKAMTNPTIPETIPTTKQAAKGVRITFSTRCVRENSTTASVSKTMSATMMTFTI